MNIVLKSSSRLKEEADKDFNLRNALYYAYKKKKGYGDDVEEIPMEEIESFLSLHDEESDDTYLSDYQVIS